MTQPPGPLPGYQPGTVPSSTVNSFHANADTDASVNATHHTLGIQHNQASPGDHKHDGKSSKKIGKGLNVAFPTTAAAAYNQAQMQAVIDALRALGLGT